MPFAADPSQQLARMDGPEIRALIDGATYLFTNDYEKGLVEQKTRLDATPRCLARVGVRITTLGAKGVVVEQAGQPTIAVEVVAERRKADPTGVGDAFRAGFLTGRCWGLACSAAAQVGSLLATLALEVDRPAGVRGRPRHRARPARQQLRHDAAAEIDAALWTG